MRAYARWVVATLLGELAGFGLVALLAAWVFGNGEPATPAVVLFAVAAGLVEGSCLAFAQARPLRERVPDVPASAWWLATAPPASGAYLVGFLGFPAVGDAALPAAAKVALLALLGIAMSLLLAGPQALVLRRHAERAGAWVPASVLAWVLGVAAAIGIVSALPADPGVARVGAYGAAAGIAMGLVVGLVTGWAFARLVPHASSTRGAFGAR